MALQSGVLLGIERVPQPNPCRSEGGDCFACSLIAALRYLFPEREPPTFEDTDRWFKGRWAEPTGLMKDALRDIATGKVDNASKAAQAVVDKLDEKENNPPTNNTWNGMSSALWEADSEGWDIEITYDMVMPQFDPRQWGYGWPIRWAGTEYVQRLEAWLSAGWVALTVCDMDARGPIIDAHLLNSTNHFLVLDGARTYWKEQEYGASQVAEVHVVDSSNRNITGWIDSQKWELAYGGTPWMLIRRDQRQRV